MKLLSKSKIIKKVITITLIILFFPFQIFPDDNSNEKQGLIQSRQSSWYLMSYSPDLREINKVITGLGLDNIDHLYSFALETKVGLPGNIYFGLMSAIPIPTFRISESVSLNRYIVYHALHTGITFDKKFSPVEKLDIYTGLLLGLTMQRVNISQSDGLDIWDFFEHKTFRNFKYTYCLSSYTLQPQVNIMYQVSNRHHLRFGMGYIIDLNGENYWKSIYSLYEFPLSDSPKTSVSGATFNIGLSTRLGK